MVSSPPPSSVFRAEPIFEKHFPEGTVIVAKVLETGDGRLRLSIKGAKDAEERAQFEEAKSKSAAPASLGTFADLLKKSQKK